MAVDDYWEAFERKISKCSTISFHMLCLNPMYLPQFKNYSGLVSVNREKSYCKYSTRRTSWAIITSGGTKKFGQVCSRCPKLGRICYFWKMVNFRRLYLLNALTQNFQPVPKLSPEHSFIQPKSGIDVLITILQIFCLK